MRCKISAFMDKMSKTSVRYKILNEHIYVFILIFQLLFMENWPDFFFLFVLNNYKYLIVSVTGKKKNTSLYTENCCKYLPQLTSRSFCLDSEKQSAVCKGKRYCKLPGAVFININRFLCLAIRKEIVN